MFAIYLFPLTLFTNLQRRREQMNLLLWYKLSVSVTLISAAQYGLSDCTFTEFFGEIDDGSPQPFVVKSPDAVDGPFPRLQEKMGNKISSKKCSKLIRSGWWAQFVVLKQSFSLVRCSILKEGSDLNIHIHKKHFRPWKILMHNSKDDLMCKTNIEFDDLWQHLISKETKCKMIFALIAPDILKIPQQTSRWDLMIQFQGYSSGWSPRYAYWLVDK